MHYFITGHTGFKGSWLILLLKELGHEVSGYSLLPPDGGLFLLANLEKDLKHNFIGDIRDFDFLSTALEIAKPDYLIHMAAQPLVLRSFEDPLETYATNVDGTLNVLKSISKLNAPPKTLIVTTDKVYRDDGKGSYVETDPLGGFDPYSASKAMADLLSQSWSNTNQDLTIRVARAGNVIGAFDVSENRLIPDAIRAIRSGEPLVVRNPSAVRPWQHVLDCLAGYLKFIEADKTVPRVLNFGPDPNSFQSVANVLRQIQSVIDEFSYHELTSSNQPKETSFLTLNSDQARRVLDWENKVDFPGAVGWSIAQDRDSQDARAVAVSQIRTYLSR